MSHQGRQSLTKRILHFLGRAIIVAVFVAAAWLLYERLREYTPQQIWQAVRGTSTQGILIALVLTVINYLILVGYDLLAIRWLGAPLPLWKIAWASLTSYAFSYNFGATLFGTSIRWRFYSTWGLSLRKIVELLFILGLTFWFGLFALAGAVFVLDPLEVPANLMEKYHPPFTDTYWFGWILLSLAIGYVSVAAVGAVLRYCNRPIPVPPFCLTLWQISIASADLLVGAAVLHALLPPMDGLTYFTTLGAFMLAFTLSVLTHVPAGYGVFELTMIAFLPQEHQLSIFAAILVFRIIYYWLPLVAGALLLAAHEFSLHGAAVPPVPEEIKHVGLP